MRDIKCHGISIGLERIDSEFFLYVKAIGRLTHEDYERITPLLDYALQGIKDPKVKALVDVEDFEGWELRAAWDDFKLALKHGNEFSRIAVVGEEKWQKVAARIASWFLSGDVQYFEEHDDALHWLAQPDNTEKSSRDNHHSTPVFPAH
ncbi:STAS/SEC14 domain-containing protein [Microbulbifer thermotolerans]|uniref:STAS/SEC14 domain-containing protein n=1 Tax=Microbulbifer thermotolerans TaxID=252514 RepID=A0AB35HXZ8_MICTH|nr:STAS/SEC14 domain-containing protein [Microbulbifer thermotolerans]MCX2784128.1 STAS/SEC14 domain-containing protein [Microbulbifer thermotolerans]MCX2801050.1 STAS/SEC14 domain-containing protein [Microbulbifer thermotolerans]MCX2834993.1 STAS/SEC14 domain-containing protein [Microbulbifer thermotolerans]